MYRYTLQFRPTAQHANADTLSRLPLPEKPTSVPLPGELVLLIDHLAEAPITAAQLKTGQQKISFCLKYSISSDMTGQMRWLTPR